MDQSPFLSDTTPPPPPPPPPPRRKYFPHHRRHRFLLPQTPIKLLFPSSLPLHCRIPLLPHLLRLRLLHLHPGLLRSPWHLRLPPPGVSLFVLFFLP